MGLVKQDLYLFVFPDVGSVLQVYLVPWVCYVFSGRCHHKPVAPAAAAPVVSASELLKPRNPPVNGRSVFSRDEVFFFFVCVPKEKTLSPGQRGGYMVYIQKCTRRQGRRTGAYREMQAGTHAVLGRTGAVACCNTGFVH